MATTRRRDPKPKTAVQTAREFCRVHLGKHCFAPFTGQDYSAWGAFVYAVELWCRSDEHGRKGAIAAMRALLRSAQDKEDVQRLFLQAIPAIGDWCHVEQIWPDIVQEFANGVRWRRIDNSVAMATWTAAGDARYRAVRS